MFRYVSESQAGDVLFIIRFESNYCKCEKIYGFDLYSFLIYKLLKTAIKMHYISMIVWLSFTHLCMCVYIYELQFDVFLIHKYILIEIKNVFSNIRLLISINMQINIQNMIKMKPFSQFWRTWAINLFLALVSKLIKCPPSLLQNASALAQDNSCATTSR